MRVALEVDRDERLVDGGEDSLHRAGGGDAERLAELVGRRRLRELRGEVDDGDGRRRDAERVAVELPLQVGDDEGDGLRGAGRRRDDRQPGGARAAQVAVRQVEDLLVVRVGVDRRHEAALDRPVVVDDLGGGGEAVRRAGGVRDDVVLRGVVDPFVDAEDDRQVLALGGRGDDDLLRPALRDVVLGPADRLPLLVHAVGLDREEAGRLDDDVDAEVFPGEVRRVGLLQHLQVLAVDEEVLAGHLDRSVEAPVGRVVLEEVSHRLQVADVVYGDDLELGGVLVANRLEDLAADAAEPVDSDFRGHLGRLLPGGFPAGDEQLYDGAAPACRLRSASRRGGGGRAGGVGGAHGAASPRVASAVPDRGAEEEDDAPREASDAGLLPGPLRRLDREGLGQGSLDPLAGREGRLGLLLEPGRDAPEADRDAIRKGRFVDAPGVEERPVAAPEVPARSTPRRSGRRGRGAGRRSAR